MGQRQIYSDNQFVHISTSINSIHRKNDFSMEHIKVFITTVTFYKAEKLNHLSNYKSLISYQNGLNLKYAALHY